MKKLIRSSLHRFGYRLVPIKTETSAPLGRFFAMLKRQGFSPKHVIDVGAHKGTWTRSAIEYFPDSYYTLIEPQAELRRHIQDLIDRGHKIEWLTAGASDQPGILDFTVSARPDSSSFLPARQEAESAGLTQIKVEVLTLNDVVRSREAPPPEMVKIDAEGFDLKVFAGASDLIGSTDIFLMEAGVVGTKIENTAVAVISALADAGYRLIDITGMSRSPKYNVLWLCDLAFLRSNSSLLDDIVSYE